MAFTVAVGADGTVWGNKQVRFLEVTADAAADAFAVPGLTAVESVQVTPKSMATAGLKVRKNALASGTAAAGYVAISGVASGDEMFIVVTGR
jgi:hypothetical protein